MEGHVHGSILMASARELMVARVAASWKQWLMKVHRPPGITAETWACRQEEWDRKSVNQ